MSEISHHKCEIIKHINANLCLLDKLTNRTTKSILGRVGSASSGKGKELVFLLKASTETFHSSIEIMDNDCRMMGSCFVRQGCCKSCMLDTPPERNCMKCTACIKENYIYGLKSFLLKPFDTTIYYNGKI